MKKVLFTLLVIQVMFVSCQHNAEPEKDPELIPEGMVSMTITAHAPESFVWADGDKIAVYDGFQVAEFKLTEGAGTSSASFKGIVDEAASEFDAVYPFDAAYLDDEYLEAEISSVQTINGTACAVSTASFTAESKDVKFILCGDVKSITVPSGFSKYVIHTVDGSKLAGMSKSLEVILPNEDGGEFSVTVNKGVSLENINIFSVKDDVYYLDGKEITAISNVAEYIAFCQNPSSDKDVYIFNDLDMGSDGSAASEGFAPIPEFSAVFDGQGCNIYNILYYYTDTNAAADTLACGLVAVLDGGTIRNMVLGSEDGENWDEKSGIQFSTRQTALAGGSFAGEIRNGALIENCLNFAYIMPNGSNAKYPNFIGGIAGRATGAPSIIKDCYNDLEVRDNDNVGGYISCLAGILGLDEAGCTIESCVNKAEIIPNNTSSRMIGGILGGQTAGGVISNCTNRGKINDGVNYLDAPFLGGIIGYQSGLDAKIVNCRNEGPVALIIPQIDASVENIVLTMGGIAGATDGTISNCINNATVTFQHSGKANRGLLKMGGIAGGALVPVMIEGCTNNGTVNHSKGYNTGYAGGIIGRLESSSSKITNCTNTGKIYTNRGVTGVCLGGIVGEINNDNIFPIKGFENCSVNCEIIMDNTSATYAKAGMLVGACLNTGSSFPITFGKEGAEAKYKGKWKGSDVSASVSHLIGTASPGTEIIFVAKYQE